jgi:hypothetical protein
MDQTTPDARSRSQHGRECVSFDDDPAWEKLLSLEQELNDGSLFLQFREFAHKHVASENLSFLLAVGT